MRKFNMSNKPATPVYLLLTLCASLLIVSCSSEEPTLEFSEEFLDNTQLTVWWASASEDAPIQVDFYNAEPNTYYKLVRSTNTDCDIQDESTCNDYKLLAELTHTMESGSQYTYYDNFISTRQYYQLYIYYPELDLNSTLPYGYIYENLPNRPNVHTTSAGNSEVYLDWDWAHGAIYYNIYYSTSSDISLSNYQGSTSTTSTEITITSLTNETSYYFIVVGVNDNGMSDYNIEGSITPSSNSPPSSPTNVTTLAGNSAVYLFWDATNNTDYYRIYYATFSGVHSSNYENFVDVSSGTSYTIDGLSNDITYYFVVYAVNSYGDSSSAEVFATPSEDSTSLLPPSGIVATSGDRSISLTWNAVSVAASYNLYVAEEGGITIDNYSNLVGGVSYSTEETSYLLDNLINGTTHYLILTAVDADGNESIASSELSATPQLPLPSDFTVAASSDLVELTWSADSELTYEIYKTTDSACDLSAHDDFSQCSDSGGSTEATFPEAQSPIADTNVTNGTLYYYWFKAYRDSEYRYADRVSALPFDYAAGINFEEASHVNLFTMSGNGDWYIDSTSGGANGTGNSFRSGSIAQGQTSCASFVGTVQDGSLRFYYRTDSSSSDGLRFYINNSQVSNFGGGSQAWTSVQLEMSAGEYTLMWCYEKYDSVASNSDSVWIDEIAFDTYAAPDSMTGNYLNDTGITVSMNSEQNLVSCDLASSSPQDCNSGRDSSDETNTSSDGSSGFSFTKIDADGNALASDASAWICVLDNVTGLLWQNASPGEYVNFSEINLDDSESICGRTGWRLPRLEELRSIVDYSSINNFSADRDYFSELSSDSYWASTTSSNGNYLINFYSGNSLHYSSSSAYYVLVNSIEDNSYLPDAWFDSRYIDNGDGTVSDKETNLIWQRCPHGMTWQSSTNTCSGSVQSRDWHDALAAAASDSTGDHSDWRIPNIKELASIVRYTGNSSPYVNTMIFPASDVFNQYSYLWSSSPYTNGAGAEVHGYSLNSREHSTSISNTNTYPYLLVRTNPQIYPNAPYNVEATAGDGNVSLTWGNVSTATSYRIYYSTSSGVGTSSDNNVSFTADMDEDSSDFTSTYTINGLTNGTIYFFVVTAIDEEGDESSASAQVSATPALPFPDDFSATGGNAQVTLDWTVTSGIGYVVHRSTDSACDVSSDTPADNCTDYATIAYVDGESTIDDGDDITNGTTYYYWLEASRSGDASRYSSAPISAIPNVLSSNRLNDTGINDAINSNGNIATGCSSNLTGLQDCNIGRDANQDTNSSTDGHLGFNFTKLNSSGNEMLASDTTWECVRDNVTGLVWEKSSTYISVASLPTIDDSFKKCGLTRWRYPRLGELLSILNYGRDSGAMVDTDYFSNLSDSSTYYSSTAYSDNGEIYGLSLSNGSTSTFIPDNNDYNYLLVTDALNSSYLPDSWGESRYIISADGNEVSDIHTNLIWQRCVLGQAWNGSTCSGSADQFDLSNVLNAGDDEWRLPNVKELSSLAALDGGKRLNSTVFPDHIEAYHWSISNNHRNSGYLYVVNFNDSDNSSDLISQFGWYDNVYYARLVKSVESSLPAPPYGLEASAGDANVTLTWSNISTATSYKIYYSATSSAGTSADNNVSFTADMDEDESDSTSTYTITGLSNGTTYYFVVTAIDGEDDESLASAQASATPSMPFPTNFRAEAGDANATLAWDPAANDDGIIYGVNRSTSATCYSNGQLADGCNDSIFIADSDADNEIIDTDLGNGTRYYYWLEAIRGTESQVGSVPISVQPSSDGGYYDFEGNLVPSDFTMSGDADWYIDNSTGANGSTASLRSGVVGGGESSCTSTTVYIDADNDDSSNELTFYYKLNTDGNNYLSLGVNTDNTDSIASSNSDWTSYSVNLTGGSDDYTITWCFVTYSWSDTSSSQGAWIDEISFTPGLVLSAEQLADNYLNDTGVQFSGDALSGNNDVCSDSNMEEDPQDCDVGRDSSADTSSTIDGAAGFAFTKLDSAGYELSADASSWACVRDDVTGLIWQNSVQTSTYQDITIDDSAEICGRSGWRLPTIEELRSIVNYGSSSPAVDSSYFSAIADGHSSAEFWTSTVFNYYGSNYYWQIDFGDGGDTNNYFTNSDRYMLVTSADNPDYLLERWPNNRYSDNGDGTVTDTYTNLIWMRCSLGQDWNSSSGACDEAASSFSWSGALNQARKSSYAEYDDWRLPNVKELTSLLKHTSSYPSINSTIFPNMPTDDGTNFWTSTPSVSTDSYSWLVDFYDYTGDTANNRVQEYYVRLVRSEETIAPAAPYGLNIEASDQNISLDWQAIGLIDNYRVYSATDSSLSIANYAGLSNGAVRDVNGSTSIKIDGLINGTRHYFLVTAVDNAGTESIASPMVSATPQLPFPDDLAIDSADAALTLNWTPYADTTLGIISYNLYRSSDSNCDISAISNCAAGASFSSVSSPFTDNNDSNGLGNGLRYYYWLEASRGSGASQELRASADPVSAIPAEDDVVYHDFAGSDPDANFYSISDSTPWYVDYSTGADGTGSSLRSGMIGDSSSSCVETYPRLDAGTLSFYYKIDSESGADKLFFYVNGSEVSTTSGGISSSSGVSGIVDWTLATYAVAFTDSYLLKWCYIKDASGESDVDAAWIDQISFPGSADSYDPENLEMPLNDTGIDWGGNSGSGNNSDCSSDMSVPQDCDQGRDADSATNDESDGHAGFSFTRLNADGTEYTGSGLYNSDPWHCVQDNVTGLIWEVKTDDGGLHDKDYTYTWYNSDESTNGGAVGDLATNSVNCDGYISGNAETYCNTEAFVNRVNNVGLCGSKDWRMPDINELSSIVNLGRISPSIDTDYFPNTTNNYHWSASPSASSSGYAWRIYFYDGYDDTEFSSYNYRVRLVRSEQ